MGLPRRTRPPSPFLAFMLGGAITVLVTEWVRFQVGLPLAVVPALTGAMFTGRIVATAFGRRRAWREAHEHALQRSALSRRRPEDTTQTRQWTIRATRRAGVQDRPAGSTGLAPSEPNHLVTPVTSTDAANREEALRPTHLEETR